MSEPIDWLPDGTPYSARFGDRYHSESGGLAQARQVFLQGCGLPHAWADQPQWRILETGFGFGLNFLVTWAAWRADPNRPRLLHFVSLEAWPVSLDDLRRAAPQDPVLRSLAQELHAHYWGLLPGVHRIALDDGRVLLTLCIGDAQSLMRQQQWTVDSVYLDGFSPQRNPDIWDLHTLKAVARCCRRGTRLATWTIARAVRDALAQCGFDVSRVPGVPPKRDNLHATYNPRWEPRAPRRNVPAPAPHTAPGRCVVVGSGLAGAATAAVLAHRGWQVQVLDQADAPAAGASGLPAGLFAPHVSPDDSVLSRLSRAGVRTTLAWAARCLQEGRDWSPCGVLEHRTDGTPGLPSQWLQSAGRDWSVPATAELLASVGLAADTFACWHLRAGWVRPAQLVAALLNQSGIEWRGGCAVQSLRRVQPSAATDPSPPSDVPPLWQVLDADGQVLAQANTVVLAAGAGSARLLDNRWPLQAVRGQVSWGVLDTQAPPLAPFPVNGHGNLVPRFPVDAASGSASAWVMGSTFERDVDTLPPTASDAQAAHAVNLDKLNTLLPTAAARLARCFGGDATTGSAEPAVRAWAAVRCTAPDRLPIVGPVDAQQLPGVWVHTAMGARGLTLSLLGAELLAARLQGEPLPLDARLARALGTERLV